MMKRKKIVQCFVLVMLSLSCLLMVGCDFLPTTDNGKLHNNSIEAPSFLKVVTLDDTSVEYYTNYENLALLVNENPTATGYAFYVYGGNGDFNNFNLYTRFVTQSNFIELKNIFGNEEGKIPFEQKRFYFYTIALGGEVEGVIYKDSSKSPTLFIDFKSRLESPNLSINEKIKIIGWQQIPSASKYEIREGSNKEDPSTFVKIAEVREAFFDFSEYFTQNKRSLNFMVKAIADSTTNFLDSEYSLIMSFIPSSCLYNPTSLELNEYILSWNEMENADSYTVVIDGQEYTTQSNNYDISFLSTIAGNHEISVLSNSNNVELGKDLTYETIYKEVYVKLETPKNIKIVQDTQYLDRLEITFDAVLNAKTYTVLANGVTLYKSLSGNLFAYDVKNNKTGINEVVFSIKANSYGYYLESDEGLTDSFKYIQQLRTPVIKSLTESVNGEKILQIEVTPIDRNLNLYVSDYVLPYTIQGNETIIGIEISGYLDSDGIYFISVESLSYDEYTATSERSLGYKYVNNVAFDAPKITSIKSSSNGANIIVEWQALESAENYRVFVNDELYTTTNSTICEISKLDVTELDGGGYNINVQAVAVNGYLDSVLGDNTYYKGFDGLNAPTGINVQKSQRGFVIVWDSVSKAESYTLYIDNEKPISNLIQTSYEYVTDEERPYQILLKACASQEEDSDFSQKIMFNNCTVNLKGYTDRYIYFNGWQDFYVTSKKEFNILCKYAFYSYNNLDIFVDSSVGLNVYTFRDFITDAVKDFGTSSISIAHELSSSVMGTVSGMKTQIDFTYTNNTQYPAQTHTISNYQIYENQKPFRAIIKTRADDYNDFVTEKSLIEMSVSNTNELYICAEGGAKPVFTEFNYKAKESYEKAKEILRNIISDDMTDFEKALAIYDYINYISVYDSFYEIENYNDTRYWLNGPLLYGVGVCDGFAKLYSLLCNMEGLQTVKISGFTLNNSGLQKVSQGVSVDELEEKDIEGHAWNKINLDVDGDGTKEWFNVDLTWDCGIHYAEGGKTYELSTHQYFLLSDAEFDNHYAYYDENEAVTEFNFYENYKIDDYGNDIYITSLNELIVYLKYLNASYDIANGLDIIINIPTYSSVTEALREANNGLGLRISLIGSGDLTFVYLTKNS